MIVGPIKRHGVFGVAKLLPCFLFEVTGLRSYYLKSRFPKSIRYCGPSETDLGNIEQALRLVGVELVDFRVDKQAFEYFRNRFIFPEDYHGGKHSGVWDEKLLEHYISYYLLELENFTTIDSYIDVAACNSPWSIMLRENTPLQAYSIDLQIPKRYADVDFYQQMDATHTCFEESSVRGMSLQCAYEMFRDNDDIALIDEVARVLQPGGRAVILPLYMHTEYCCYASPEYHGKGFAAKGANEYVHIESKGIPSSRKYDAATLYARILSRITERGLEYRLLILRNKREISDEIYCHFILEISKQNNSI